MQFKRVIFYLLINIVISASTMLIVLNFWERTHIEAQEQAELSEIIPSQGVASDSTFANVPAFEPSIDLQPHKVQPNETLSEIAQAYGVDVETILELNGKTNADSLGTGEIIYVPAATYEMPEATDVSEDSPTADMNVITNNEIKIDSVIGVADLGTERVVLVNKGDGRTSMAGWELIDADGNIYPFSQTTLYGNGAITVNTRSDTDTSLELFWGLSGAIWESGEIVTLFDSHGNEVDRYQIP